MAQTVDAICADGVNGEFNTRQGTQVCVAILGARGHYGVPKLLNCAGMLGKFYTDLYLANNGWRRVLEAIPPKLRPRFAERVLGRFDGELPKDKAVSFNALGLWYAWQRRIARDQMAMDRVHIKMARDFGCKVVRRGLNGSNVLYGVNGAALELFQYARERRVRCLLEQALAPRKIVRALLTQEVERWPGWEPSLMVEQSDDPIGQREQQEWALSDTIVAGSPFVIDGLRQLGVPETKCRWVPYGVSLKSFSAEERDDRQSALKLKVLFAGEVGLRKGAVYLLSALQLLNSPYIQAKFAGPVSLKSAKLRSFLGHAAFLGAVPRNRMIELYRWADLLVLPSICEGSALVTYEALASGLPVIATPNTGAPVRDGTNGVIVPIRDVEALAHAIERFARDHELLRFYRHNAVLGRDHLGLDAYQQRLAAVASTMS